MTLLGVNICDILLFRCLLLIPCSFCASGLLDVSWFFSYVSPLIFLIQTQSEC